MMGCGIALGASRVGLRGGPWRVPFIIRGEPSESLSDSAAACSTPCTFCTPLGRWMSEVEWGWRWEHTGALGVLHVLKDSPLPQVQYIGTDSREIV